MQHCHAGCRAEFPTAKQYHVEVWDATLYDATARVETAMNLQPGAVWPVLATSQGAGNHHPTGRARPSMCSLGSTLRAPLAHRPLQ